MTEVSPADVHAEAVRVQRALEETLDRYAGKSEGERAEALAETLRAAIGDVPPPSRVPLLRALEGFYPAPPAGAGTENAVAALEAEVARLRDAARPTPAAAPAAAGGEFAREVAALLLGRRGDPDGLLREGRAAEERVVAALRSLIAFVEKLTRTFLGATAEGDQTVSGRLQTVLARELLGKAERGSLEATLGQIERQAGALILAFREACDTGASNLLRQLSPAAIEALSAKANPSKMLGRRPFLHRENWEQFEKTYEELRTSDNLYETYFDGAFRGALHRIGRADSERKGGR